MIIDLRDFTFFIKSIIEEGKQFNIHTLDFVYSGTSTFSAKNINIKQFGYFTVDLSQSEQSGNHVWNSGNILGLLSNLGGYSTVLASFFALLIGNYQSFVYDKSMLKKLYF